MKRRSRAGKSVKEKKTRSRKAERTSPCRVGPVTNYTRTVNAEKTSQSRRVAVRESSGKKEGGLDVGGGWEKKGGGGGGGG